MFSFAAESLLAGESLDLLQHFVQRGARIILATQNDSENLAGVANIVQGICVEQYQVGGSPNFCDSVFVAFGQEERRVEGSSLQRLQRSESTFYQPLQFVMQAE